MELSRIGLMIHYCIIILALLSNTLAVAILYATVGMVAGFLALVADTYSVTKMFKNWS